LARQTVTVATDVGLRTFSGGARVFTWSGGNAPHAIETALMALEQYFYQELDAGGEIAPRVTAVLAQARSAAFLRVLIDVGKRNPALFLGPLRGVLASPPSSCVTRLGFGEAVPETVATRTTRSPIPRRCEA
jgi:hypothetical protein